MPPSSGLTYLLAGFVLGFLASSMLRVKIVSVSDDTTTAAPHFPERSVQLGDSKPEYPAVAAPASGSAALPLDSSPPPRASTAPPGRVLTRGPPVQGLAQYGEDRYAMDNFFPTKLGGVIVESGALDGLRFSSTYLFVKEAGWQAVHVEASPVSFAELAKNRPESINVHAALCAKEGTVHYIGPEETSVSGAVGGIVEFMTPDFLELFWPKDFQGVRRGIYGGGRAVETPVQCRRMDSILGEHGITRVDLWVLDVEGGELQVLHTIDLGKVEIDVIVVELDGRNKPKDQAVIDLLGRQGYSVHSRFPDQNTWFVHKRFALPAAKKNKRKL